MPTSRESNNNSPNNNGDAAAGLSKTPSLSLSQLQNLVAARHSAAQLTKTASSSKRKTTVKCTRCGTKKKISKDKLNTRTKCVCGEVFVAQSKRRTAMSSRSPSTSPTNGLGSLPSLGSRFKMAAKRAVGKFGVGDLVAQLQLSRLPDAHKAGKVWKAEPNYEGQEARSDFFDMYKSSNKQEVLRRDAEEDSPRQAYFEAAQRLGLSPEPGKILRKAGSAVSERINIRDYSLGDARVIAMLPALKLMGYQSLDLSGNRVGPKGALALVTSLPETCFEIDLSRNALNKTSVEGLTTHVLLKPRFEVCQLNLSGNGLRNDAIRHLAAGIGNCASLKRLNVDNNGFSDAAGLLLVESLSKLEALVDLSMSWNNLHQAAIASIRDIASLEHLELAMVSIGSEGRDSDHVGDCVEIADTLSKNKKLLHLDLSHNNFSAHDIDVIGDGLLENHTLIGLHITGVSGTFYDSLGFLYCTPPGELGGDQENLAPGAMQSPTAAGGASPKPRFAAAGDHAMQQYAASVKYQESGPWLDLPYTLMRKGTHKNCWICEAWQETRISLVVSPEEHPEIYAFIKKSATATVNVHLSCDFWRPLALARTKKKPSRVIRSRDETKTPSGILGIEFFAYRFLPPGDTYFYFSIPVETAFDAANAGAPQDPTASVRVFVSSQYKVLGFSNWLQNDVMKRWAPPKKQWRVDVIPDEDRKMKARHSSQGSDVFDFLRAADPGVVETKERTPSRASSPKSGSLATTPKRGKGLQLHGAPSSPALASSSSSPSTAAVNGSPPLKKVWIDRGYEGYVIAACIMNEVNSINIKHRPYAQAIACRNARIRDAAAGVIGGRRFQWNLNLSIFASRSQAADCRAFYRTDKFVQRMFRADFKFTKLRAFYKQQTKNAADPGGIASDEEINTIIMESYDALAIIFKHSCAKFCDSKEDPYSIKKNGFTALCRQCGIMEGGQHRFKELGPMKYAKAKALNISELDLIFITTNLEPDEDGAESEAQGKMNDDNPDNAVNRFEWMEAIVRIAAERYKVVPTKADIPESIPGEPLPAVPFANAVRATIGDVLSAARKNGILVDNDEFRRNHFYSEPMDDLYRSIESEAKVLFNLASGRSRGDYHGRCKYTTWLTFVKTMSNNLIDVRATLDHARSAFIYSKMDATTCFINSRNCDLDFVDFMEAMCRLACYAFEEGTQQTGGKTAAIATAKLLLNHFTELASKQKFTSIRKKLAAFLSKMGDT